MRTNDKYYDVKKNILDVIKIFHVKVIKLLINNFDCI